MSPAGLIAFGYGGKDFQFHRSLQCFSALMSVYGLKEQLGRWLLGRRSGHIDSFS
jgi:hypothetical protein